MNYTENRDNMEIIVKMLEVLNFTNVVDIMGQTFIVMMAIFPYLLAFVILQFIIYKIIKSIWK